MLLIENQSINESYFGKNVRPNLPACRTGRLYFVSSKWVFSKKTNNRPAGIALLFFQRTI